MSVASRYPKFGQFNAAIGSRVPNSIEKYPEYQKCRPNRELLKREQLDLLHILREKMHLDVTELVPEEKTPLCCFVEDLAIVFNGKALLTRGLKSGDPRELEIKSLKIALKDYGIEILFMDDLSSTLPHNPMEMNGGTGENTLENEVDKEPKRIVGGDVLFTGYEFFIGISYYTNIEGAMEFAAKMTDLAVTIIKLPLDSSNDPEIKSRRLKDYISVACEGLLVYADTVDGNYLMKQIINNSSYDYNTVRMRAEFVANCIYINGYLLYPDTGNTLCSDGESDYRLLDQLISRIPVPATEFSRIKTSLSRRVLIFDAPHTHGARRHFP